MVTDYLFMDEIEAVNITMGPIMAVPVSTWREVVHVLQQGKHSDSIILQLASMKLLIRKLKDQDIRRMTPEFILDSLIDNCS